VALGKADPDTVWVSRLPKYWPLAAFGCHVAAPWTSQSRKIIAAYTERDWHRWIGRRVAVALGPTDSPQSLYVLPTCVGESGFSKKVAGMTPSCAFGGGATLATKLLDSCPGPIECIGALNGPTNSPQSLYVLPTCVGESGFSKLSKADPDTVWVSRLPQYWPFDAFGCHPAAPWTSQCRKIIAAYPKRDWHRWIGRRVAVALGMRPTTMFLACPWPQSCPLATFGCHPTNSAQSLYVLQTCVGESGFSKKVAGTLNPTKNLGELLPWPNQVSRCPQRTNGQCLVLVCISTRSSIARKYEFEYNYYEYGHRGIAVITSVGTLLFCDRNFGPI
jgi:hypothetical protein